MSARAGYIDPHQGRGAVRAPVMVDPYMSEEAPAGEQARNDYPSRAWTVSPSTVHGRSVSPTTIPSPSTGRVRYDAEDEGFNSVRVPSSRNIPAPYISPVPTARERTPVLIDAYGDEDDPLPPPLPPPSVRSITTPAEEDAAPPVPRSGVPSNALRQRQATPSVASVHSYADEEGNYDKEAESENQSVNERVQPSRAPRTRGPGSRSQPAQYSATSSDAGGEQRDTGITRMQSGTLLGAGPGARTAGRQEPEPRRQSSPMVQRASSAGRDGLVQSVRGDTPGPTEPSQHQSPNAMRPSVSWSGGAGPGSSSDVRQSYTGGRPPIANRASSPGGGKKVQFVATSVFTQKNPFRMQPYEEFCASPNYTLPRGFRELTDGMGTGWWTGFQRAGEGQFRNEQLSADGQAESSSSALTQSLSLHPNLSVLQDGDWFLKWTRTNVIHKRYVWLDLVRATLYWGKTRKTNVLMLSQLRLDEITGVVPECIIDEELGRVVYKMSLRVNDRTVMFGTEVREKFDLWVDTLQQLTAATRTIAQQFWHRTSKNPQHPDASANGIYDNSPLVNIMMYGEHGGGTDSGARGLYAGQVLSSD